MGPFWHKKHQICGKALTGSKYGNMKLQGFWKLNNLQTNRTRNYINGLIADSFHLSVSRCEDCQAGAIFLRNSCGYWLTKTWGLWQIWSQPIIIHYQCWSISILIIYFDLFCTLIINIYPDEKNLAQPFFVGEDVAWPLWTCAVERASAA